MADGGSTPGGLFGWIVATPFKQAASLYNALAPRPNTPSTSSLAAQSPGKAAAK